MDVIDVAGKTYGVVITRDEHSMEVGIWQGAAQVLCIVIDAEGVHIIDN